MSPALHGSTPKLTTTDASSWSQVWSLSNYEVEPSAVQGGGAIESFNGYLYFGTMHVPGTGALGFAELYGSTSDDAAAFLGSYRPITIFRSKGFSGKKPTVSLLYGNEFLPQYDPTAQQWNLVPNGLHEKGKYGTAGFGNFFNNYTWSAEVYKGNLFFGTMDFSYLASELTFDNMTFQDLPEFMQQEAEQSFGADLWYFTDSDKPAKLINGNGMGNGTSYGIRNLVAGPDNLWIGIANPMNLRTDPAHNPGGWKLMQLH
jgi:hypothetical protein